MDDPPVVLSRWALSIFPRVMPGRRVFAVVFVLEASGGGPRDYVDR